MCDYALVYAEKKNNGDSPYSVSFTATQNGDVTHRPSPPSLVGCPQDPKENSLPAQKGTHEANLMLECSNTVICVRALSLQNLINCFLSPYALGTRTALLRPGQGCKGTH